MAVVVYGGEGCQQCVTAKTTLYRKGVEFEYQDLTPELKAELESKFSPLPRSLPIITLDEKVYSFSNLTEVIKLAKG